MDLKTSAIVGLAVLLLGGIVYSVADALDDRAREAELRQRGRHVERLVDVAYKSAGASQQLHARYLDVRTRERARRDSLEQLRARQAAAADSAEALAIEVRGRLRENFVELLRVVHRPVRPLVRTTRAQVDSALGAQQTTIDELRGMATSLNGQLASLEREYQACVADVEGCHRARRKLQTAVDSLSVLNEDLEDVAFPSPWEDLFGSFGEGAVRVAGTVGACLWDEKACLGAVGIQVLEVAF